MKNKDKGTVKVILDKINLLWGIVTECKADVEALQKLFHEKTPKNLLSRLGLKWSLNISIVWTVYYEFYEFADSSARRRSSFR